ncbi:MAG: response regulator [Nitrospirae bacterium]|nr:MAG: response regulator [Nitrospirota bacterium]
MYSNFGYTLIKEAGKINILLVDDEPSIVSALLQYLDRRGYGVAGVTKAEIAEPLAISGIFDLMILDINLEDITGIELYNRVKEQGYKGEVLFITAYSEQYLEELIEIEQSRLIQKPFRLYTILEKIKELSKNPVSQ